MTSTRPSTMIVAREPQLRAAVRAALEPAVDCSEADGPAAAVDIAAKLHPDVCFVDADQNGNGSAIRTVELIHGAHAKAHVVLLFASDSEAEFLRALRAGADGYLPRSIDPSRLPQIVEALLRGEPAIPRILVGRLVDELRHLGRRQITTPDQGVVDLTRREAEVLDLVREGRTTHAIAHRLGIADGTVRRHRSALFAKLGVNTNAELLRLLDAV
jgi:DNA-binding NarL/FixJ family response regulator